MLGYRVKAEITVASTIENFEAQKDQLRTSIAASVGVLPEYVTLTATSASVKVGIVIQVVGRAGLVDSADTDVLTPGMSTEAELLAVAEHVNAALSELLAESAESPSSSGPASDIFSALNVTIIYVDAPSAVKSYVMPAPSPPVPSPVLLAIPIALGLALVAAGASAALQVRQRANAMKKAKKYWNEKAPSFYFISAKDVLVHKSKALPRMQTLRDAGLLKRFAIPLASAFLGEGVIKSILFVSHRWESPSQPDTKGVQLEAIKAHLKTHPEIEWVWFEYAPARTRQWLQLSL